MGEKHATYGLHNLAGWPQAGELGESASVSLFLGSAQGKYYEHRQDSKYESRMKLLNRTVMNYFQIAKRWKVR